MNRRPISATRERQEMTFRATTHSTCPSEGVRTGWRRVKSFSPYVQYPVGLSTPSAGRAAVHAVQKPAPGPAGYFPFIPQLREIFSLDRLDRLFSKTFAYRENVLYGEGKGYMGERKSFPKKAVHAVHRSVNPLSGSTYGHGRRRSTGGPARSTPGPIAVNACGCWTYAAVQRGPQPIGRTTSAPALRADPLRRHRGPLHGPTPDSGRSRRLAAGPSRGSKPGRSNRGRSGRKTLKMGVRP